MVDLSNESSEIDWEAEEQLLAKQQQPQPERDPKILRRAASGLAVNLPGLYTIPGVIGGAFESPEEKEARALKGEPPPFSLPGHQRAEEMAMQVNDNINAAFGIDNAQTPIEVGAELLTTLLPAGWLSIPNKIAKYAPKLTKVIEALVVPGVQGKYTPLKAGANFGIPFTIQQGLTELIDPDAKTVFGSSENTPDIDWEKEEALSQSALPYQTTDVDWEKEELIQLDQEEEQSNFMKGVAIAALTTGAIALGVRQRSAKLDEEIARKTAPPSLSTPKPSENVTTGGELAIGAAFDENAPLVSQVKKAAGKDAGDLVEAQTTLSNQIGIRGQSAEAFNTGRMPVLMGSGDQHVIKMAVSPKDLNFAAEQLDPVRRQGLTDMSLAMDEASMMKDIQATYSSPEALAKLPEDKRVQIETALKEGKSLLGGKTVKELDDLVRYWQKDEAVAPLVKGLQDAHKSLLRYQQQTGLRSKKAVGELMTKYPYYVSRSDYEKVRIQDVLFGQKHTMDPLDMVDGSLNGSRLDEIVGRGTEFQGTFKDPLSVLESQIKSTIRAAQVNNMRRMAINALRNEDGSFKIKGIHEVSPERLKRSHNVIKTLDGGVPRYYSIGDETLYNILKNGAHTKQLEPILAGLDFFRQIKQLATTGPWNVPFQAISGQFWEPVWNAIVLPKGLNMGGIKAPAVGVIGAVKGFKANHQARMADFFRQEAMLKGMGLERKNPSWITKLFQNMSKNLPEEQLTALADSYADAYAKSPVALLRSMGGVGTKSFYDTEGIMNLFDPKARENLYNAVKSTIDKNYVPDQVGGKNLSHTESWTGYYFRSVMDALHNGTRYQLTDINKKVPKGYKAGQDITKEYIDDLGKLSSQMRGLLDASKKGSSDTARTFSAAFPYGNIALQGFARLGKAAKENPVRFYTAMSGVMMAGMMQAYYLNRDPAMREELKTLTSTQKNKFIIPAGTSIRDGVAIPLDPVTALAFRLGYDFFDATFGASSGMMDANFGRNLDAYFGFEDGTGLTPSERAAADWGAVGSRAFGLGTPPLVGMGLGAMNVKINADNELSPLYGQKVQQYNDLYGIRSTKYVDGIVTTQLDTLVTAALSASMGAFIDMAEGAKMHLDMKPNDIIGALGEAKDQLGMRIFGTGRMPTQTYTVEAQMIGDYKESMKSVKAILADAKRHGAVTQGGVGYSGRVAPGIPNQQQAEILLFIEDKMQKLDDQYAGGAQGIRYLQGEKQSILSDPRRSLAQRKAEEEKINQRIQMLEKNYLRDIHRLEDFVGQQIGVAEFDLRDYVEKGFSTGQ